MGKEKGSNNGSPKSSPVPEPKAKSVKNVASSPQKAQGNEAKDTKSVKEVKGAPKVPSPPAHGPSGTHSNSPKLKEVKETPKIPHPPAQRTLTSGTHPPHPNPPKLKEVKDTPKIPHPPAQRTLTSGTHPPHPNPPKLKEVKDTPKVPHPSDQVPGTSGTHPLHPNYRPTSPKLDHFSEVVQEVEKGAKAAADAESAKSAKLHKKQHDDLWKVRQDELELEKKSEILRKEEAASERVKRRKDYGEIVAPKKFASQWMIHSGKVAPAPPESVPKDAQGQPPSPSHNVHQPKQKHNQTPNPMDQKPEKNQPKAQKGQKKDNALSSGHGKSPQPSKISTLLQEEHDRALAVAMTMYSDSGHEPHPGHEPDPEDSSGPEETQNLAHTQFIRARRAIGGHRGSLTIPKPKPLDQKVISDSTSTSTQKKKHHKHHKKHHHHHNKPVRPITLMVQPQDDESTTVDEMDGIEPGSNTPGGRHNSRWLRITEAQKTRLHLMTLSRARAVRNWKRLFRIWKEHYKKESEMLVEMLDEGAKEEQEDEFLLLAIDIINPNTMRTRRERFKIPKRPSRNKPPKNRRGCKQLFLEFFRDEEEGELRSADEREEAGTENYDYEVELTKDEKEARAAALAKVKREKEAGISNLIEAMARKDRTRGLQGLLRRRKRKFSSIDETKPFSEAFLRKSSLEEKEKQFKFIKNPFSVVSAKKARGYVEWAKQAKGGLPSNMDASDVFQRIVELIRAKNADLRRKTQLQAEHTINEIKYGRFKGLESSGQAVPAIAIEAPSSPRLDRSGSGSAGSPSPTPSGRSSMESTPMMGSPHSVTLKYTKEAYERFLAQGSEEDSIEEIGRITDSEEKARNVEGRSRMAIFKDRVMDCYSEVSLRVRRAYRGIDLRYLPVRDVYGCFGVSAAMYFRWLRTVLLMNFLYFLAALFLIVIPEIHSWPTSSEKLDGNRTSMPYDLFLAEGFMRDTILFYHAYSPPSTPKDYDSPFKNSAFRFLVLLIFVFVINTVLVAFTALDSFKVKVQLDKNGLNLNNKPFFRAVFCSWDWRTSCSESAAIQRQLLYKEYLGLCGLLEGSKWAQTHPRALNFWRRLGRAGPFLTHWILHLVFLGIGIGVGTSLYKVLDFRIGHKHVHHHDEHHHHDEEKDEMRDRFEHGEGLTSGMMYLSPPALITFVGVFLGPLAHWVTSLETWMSYSRKTYSLIFRIGVTYLIILLTLFVFWTIHSQGIIDLNKTDRCWETEFGEELFRIVVLDFLTYVVKTIIVDWWYILAVRPMLCPVKDKLIRKPPFEDIGLLCNLVFLHSLSGLGLFFCPLLSGIVILRLVLTFYWNKLLLFKTKRYPPYHLRETDVHNPFLFGFFISYILVTFLSVWMVTEGKSSKTCGPFIKYIVPREAFAKILSARMNDVIGFVTGPAFVYGVLCFLASLMYAARSFAHGYLSTVAGIREMINYEKKERNVALSSFFQLSTTVGEKKGRDSEGGQGQELDERGKMKALRITKMWGHKKKVDPPPKGPGPSNNGPHQQSPLSPASSIDDFGTHDDFEAQMEKGAKKELYREALVERGAYDLLPVINEIDPDELPLPSLKNVTDTEDDESTKTVEGKPSTLVELLGPRSRRFDSSKKLNFRSAANKIQARRIALDMFHIPNAGTEPKKGQLKLKNVKPKSVKGKKKK